MRALFGIALAALLIAKPASAQTCMAGTDLTTYTGSINLSTESYDDRRSSLGAGVVAAAQSLFIGVRADYIMFHGFDDDFVDDSELGLGGTIGYQVPVSVTKKSWLCPFFSIQHIPGPSGSLIDRKKLDMGIGLAFGARVNGLPLVPTVSATFGRSREKVSGFGQEEFSTESYGRLGFGLGVQLLTFATITPSISVPLGLDVTEVSGRVTLSLGVGRR